MADAHPPHHPGHHHGHDHDDPGWWPTHSRVGAVCMAIVGLLALVTAAAAFAMWPHDAPSENAQRTPAPLAAEVTGVDADCLNAPPGQDCRRITVRLEEGPDAGTEASMDMSRGVPIGVGDKVLVTGNGIPDGVEIQGRAPDAYAFSDFRRLGGLGMLALIFAGVVVAVTRWQGVRALGALALNLAVIVFFVVPAIAAGASPTAVALVAGMSIVLISFPISHGLGPKSVAALLGVAVALAITVALGELAVRVAHLTGFASEEATFLRAIFPDLSARGLLLAGLIIGALGVLDDLAITQSATVMSLRRVDGRLGVGRLFHEAQSVGKDHIGAVVNTLILAYAGASLPVLMIFASQGTSLLDALNSEIVAAEVVPMLVGSIGLVAAVPVTTFFAAILATRVPRRALGDAHHHAH